MALALSAWPFNKGQTPRHLVSLKSPEDFSEKELQESGIRGLYFSATWETCVKVATNHMAMPRKTLELAGFSGFEHLKLEEMGFKKGETGVTAEQIRAVAERRGDAG